MAKDDRLPVSPILIEDLDAVSGCNKWHGSSFLVYTSRAGGRKRPSRTVNSSAAPRAEPQDHVMLLGSKAPDEIGLPSQLSSRADDCVPAIRAHEPSLCPPWFLLRHSHARRVAKLLHRAHDHARDDALGQVH